MGTIDTLCVSLIVAMSVQRTFVAQCISSTLAFWCDMVDFKDVSILKEPFTPAAFSALFLEQFSERSIHHGMPSPSLTPVAYLSVIGTCCPLDFDMSLKLRAIMFP